MKYLKQEIIEKIINLNNQRIELKDKAEILPYEKEKEYQNLLLRIKRIDLDLKHQILWLEKIVKSK